MRYLTAAVSAALVLVAMFALVAVAEGRKGKAKTTGSGYEKVVFIDNEYPFHGGPPPHIADASATDFKKIQGGISWPGAPVEYSVSTAGCDDNCDDAVAQVDTGFDEWEESGVTFSEDANPSPDNPCTPGSGNSVSWDAIDGEGRTLAFASVCRNVVTKDIVGFEIVFDSGDTWSDSGEAGKFDIQATAAHESGHGVGLDHVNAQRAAALTMFPRIAAGDVGPRTLGCGDRLGVNALYGTTLGCTAAEVPND